VLHSRTYPCEIQPLANEVFCAGSEVLTVVSLKRSLFWDVTPYREVLLTFQGNILSPSGAGIAQSA
jgi:hypothetical protein